MPVTLKEYLMLMEGAGQATVIDRSVDDFYYLSRAALVKDEKNLDKFDQVFGHVFKGLERIGDGRHRRHPGRVAEALSDQFLTDEEKEADRGHGRLRQADGDAGRAHAKAASAARATTKDGKGRAATARNSPFGANGYHPEGIRIGQDKGRHGKAIKVWDKREYKNLDDQVELGTRNIKVALRRLRKFARHGPAGRAGHEGHDQGDGQQGLSRHRSCSPERRNTIKVLMFFDIGGSMDSHIKVCEELFSAARTEFKNMEFYYFHNCLYESVWKDNRRRHAEKLNTWDMLNKYPPRLQGHLRRRRDHEPLRDHLSGRLGGALERGGRARSGWTGWRSIYDSVVWLNPTAERHWDYTPSIGVMRQLVGDRMFPLTLEGLDKAMKELAR